MYRVFLGAPPAKDLQQETDSYSWTTASSVPATITKHPSSVDFSQLPPPATLEAASRRISLIYQNIIFQDNDEDNSNEHLFDASQESRDSTGITWDPTPSYDREHDTTHSKSHINKSRSFINTSTSRFVQTQTQFETQETQESQSYNYSDTSSIARFPQFHFSLHILTSLSSLAAKTKSGQKGSTKVNVLLAVLEVEGPETIRIKKGPDAGKEISLLKMIMGDEDGNVCKLTAWREVAETWGGVGEDEDAIGVKRGDVVLIQNVTAAYEPNTSPTLSASPYLKSKLEICFRTMPYTHEDMRLRPDLRLGGMDACVRKVAAVVRWFEGMAGLAQSA